MKSDKIFDSQILIGGSFAALIDNAAIKSEPMFFNCSPDFAYNNGGPITQSFLDALPAGWGDAVFDSRVHMLMPGWYPAIPGYHHDDVPRPTIPTGQHFLTAGQPDYDAPAYLSEHIMGLVNAEVAPTHFAIGRCDMKRVPDGDLIYRQWHYEIEAKLAASEISRIDAPDRQLIHFDWQSFHTGSQAVKNGWRWFGRISRNTDRAKSVTNEFRRNAQVYLEFPMEGW